MLKSNDKIKLPDKTALVELAEIRQLNHSLGFLLSKVTQRIGELHEGIFAAEDITPKQYGILVLLCQFDDLTQIEIGRRLDIDRSTMVALVDDLEGKNIVIRARDPKDRRAYLISNTEKGQLAHQRITDSVTSNEASYFEFLGEKGVDQLGFLLREILLKGR
ncbi:MAG: MarR family transcriptional regulator [Paracoccaceae bacterium]